MFLDVGSFYRRLGSPEDRLPCFEMQSWNLSHAQPRQVSDKANEDAALPLGCRKCGPKAQATSSPLYQSIAQPPLNLHLKATSQLVDQGTQGVQGLG